MSKAVVVSLKNRPRPARRSRRAADVATPPSPPLTSPARRKVVEESRRWLGIINAHKLNEYRRRRIVADTVDNFHSYCNRGYLEYRKSVTEGGEYAAIEWSGRGSYFEDMTGRRFIDCLGGYGIYSAGINHPKIVRAVKSQLERMPLSSQELLDPLRGALASLLGELAPGDLQQSFFINNGTDAVEGAMKLARLYTGKPGFISCVRGLGLLLGLELVDTQFGYAVAAGLFRRGVLVAGTLLSARTLRIQPALNIPRPLVDEVLEKLEDTLEELTE